MMVTGCRLSKKALTVGGSPRRGQAAEAPHWGKPSGRSGRSFRGFGDAPLRWESNSSLHPDRSPAVQKQTFDWGEQGV